MTRWLAKNGIPIARPDEVIEALGERIRTADWPKCEGACAPQVVVRRARAAHMGASDDHGGGRVGLVHTFCGTDCSPADRTYASTVSKEASVERLRTRLACRSAEATASRRVLQARAYAPNPHVVFPLCQGLHRAAGKQVHSGFSRKLSPPGG